MRRDNSQKAPMFVFKVQNQKLMVYLKVALRMTTTKIADNRQAESEIL